MTVSADTCQSEDQPIKANRNNKRSHFIFICVATRLFWTDCQPMWYRVDNSDQYLFTLTAVAVDDSTQGQSTIMATVVGGPKIADNGGWQWRLPMADVIG